MINGLSTRFGKKNGVHRKYNIKCFHCGIIFHDWLSNNRKFCSKECYGDSLKGKPFIEVTDDVREVRRNRMLGENNPMWCGGDSDSDRRNSEYIKWRIDVFDRDNFTCQKCGYFNGCGVKRRDLNAHHIIPWIDSIELRYEVDNGTTLCIPCHIKNHTDKD